MILVEGLAKEDDLYKPDQCLSFERGSPSETSWPESAGKVPKMACFGSYSYNILYGASIAVRGWKRRQRFGLRDRIYLAVKLSGGERRIISGTNDLLGYFAYGAFY